MCDFCDRQCDDMNFCGQCPAAACPECAAKNPVPPGDPHTCHAAFFEGSGLRRGTNDKLCRLRHLTGAHGLRPIRVRLVAYLVPPTEDRMWKCVTCCTSTADSLLATLLRYGGKWRYHDGKFSVTRWPRLPWQPKEATPRLPLLLPYDPYDGPGGW